jgi:polyisoprenoid-binding protein YceI
MNDRALKYGLIFVVVSAALSLFAAFAGETFRAPKEAAAPIQSIPLALDTLDAEVTVYEIKPEESEVRFTLGEILRGVPTAVIGKTDQVAGQIAFDFADLSTAKVGTIQVNARTLLTDNNSRNRAIRNRILFTDAFEFVTFEPTAVTGLPDSVETGDTVEFQITGDLTVRDTTSEVTFDVTVTAVSPSRIEGAAAATVMRRQFNLRIPSVSNVVGVDEEVILEIDFVAEAE